MIEEAFRGQVLSTKRLRSDRVLMVDPEFDGQVQPGDWIELTVTSGKQARARVISVGWGSSLQGDAAPLMLLVTGLEAEPAEGTEVYAAGSPD